IAWEVVSLGERRPLQWVVRNGLVSRSNWELSQNVLKALHSQLTLKYCRTWMVWNTHLPSLLQKVACYSVEPPESITRLALRWNGLIERSSQIWDQIVQCRSLPAQQLDEFEMIEHDILLRDEDLEFDVVNDEVIDAAVDEL
ncbi:hypothetical protein DFH28DRAFT_916198, partial [Melampsora americana]